MAPGVYMIYSLLFLLALSNPGTGLALGGPMLAGFYFATKYIHRGQSAGIELFFDGFQNFAAFLLLHLLMMVLIFLGFLLLIIPGIYFSVSYLFAPFFVCFYDVPPTEAIRLSRKMVSGSFIQVFWICLLLLGLNLLGLLAMGVGLLISIPVSACVTYAIFDDIIGIPK